MILCPGNYPKIHRALLFGVFELKYFTDLNRSFIFQLVCLMIVSFTLRKQQNLFKINQINFHKRLEMFISSHWTIKYDFTQCFNVLRINTRGVTPFTIILPHYQTITISINIIRFSNAPIKIIENRSSCFPLPNPFSSIVSCTKT